MLYVVSRCLAALDAPVAAMCGSECAGDVLVVVHILLHLGLAILNKWARNAMVESGIGHAMRMHGMMVVWGHHGRHVGKGRVRGGIGVWIIVLRRHMMVRRIVSRHCLRCIAKNERQRTAIFGGD